MHSSDGLYIVTSAGSDKTHYIQNNPLLYKFILYKLFATSLRVWIHTDLHMYDVIREQILLIVKYVEANVIVK